ncbi:S15/NS1 RNA-binding domain-containing protein [Ceratobasidium sp. AG-I]|nr:S15/NS1 RNA-binding domain-containing protein [Ceratobasidium sp. AG-I]
MISVKLKRVTDAMIQSPSTSRILPPLSRSFHITSSLNETYKSRQARAVKKKNLQKRQESKQSETSARPDAVLGHSRNPEGEKLWQQSDLCKILLTPAKILESQTREVHSVSGTIPLPEHLNFGIKSPEEELVFRALPEVVSQQTFFQTTKAQYDAENPRHAHALEEAEAKATIGAIHLARIADLRNASAAGIAAENRRRCVEAFSLPDKPNDTGRSEVQAAIWTAEIRNLASHLKTNTHDIHNRRSLRRLVHKRAKILRYLRKTDPARYQAILPRLGLEAKAVEGELLVYGPSSK